ncbi:MAG: RidA family protein [Acidobacteriota bacterium]
MEKNQVNPWTWQDPYGFSQAWKVQGAQTLVFVSGQASISADGQVMHGADFKAQVRLAFQNLKTVLEQSGASLEDVVKLGVYLLGMEHLPEYGEVEAEFFRGKMPAQTAVGVSSLALPGMLVEVEAIAVR